MASPPLILIVDDEAAIVTGLTFRLQAAGYRVTAAHTGREALALAAAEPPDLILLDRRLPDMTDEDVLRELQLRPETSRIPVVLQSGQITDDQDVLKVGAVGFLSKPYQKDELLTLLARHLQAPNT